MNSFFDFWPYGLRDSSFIRCVIIHCYHYSMLELHDLIWSSWQLGDIIRDARIFTLGLTATSAGPCFPTPRLRVCPWIHCCSGSSLSAQCPCWGDRRPHITSPSPDSPTSLPSSLWMGIQGGRKPDSLSPLFLCLRQLSRRQEACYLICEMGQSTGTSLTSSSQELLARATL